MVAQPTALKVTMKKPYQPPKLTVYGDLTQMTLGMLGGKKKDSAIKGMVRT